MKRSDRGSESSWVLGNNGVLPGKGNFEFLLFSFIIYNSYLFLFVLLENL